MINYDDVTTAANSTDTPRDPDRFARAAEVAEDVIMELFSDVAYSRLHPNPLRSGDLIEQKQRTDRAIDFLMAQERATATNVAFVTLFLLGRPASDRRNLFAAKVTDVLSDVGAQVPLRPR